jgi:hypothetical protein
LTGRQQTVGYFISILASWNAEAGVLIAVNGITGDPELENLTCTADLTELLNGPYFPRHYQRPPRHTSSRASREIWNMMRGSRPDRVRCCQAYRRQHYHSLVLHRYPACR